MKVLIQTYKTFEISFDTDKEEFHAISDKFDYEKGFKSFGAAKKFIEDHIKANKSFKPIFVRNTSGMFNKLIKITGQRKGGGFSYMDGDKHRAVISEYDLKNLIIEQPGFEEIIEKEAEIEHKIMELRNEIHALKQPLRESKTLLDLQNEIGKI